MGVCFLQCLCNSESTHEYYMEYLECLINDCLEFNMFIRHLEIVVDNFLCQYLIGC